MHLGFILQSSSLSTKAEKDEVTNECSGKKTNATKTLRQQYLEEHLQFKSRKTLKRQEHVTCK